MARPPAMLAAAAALYRAGARLYHGLHDRGRLPRQRLPVPVLSVGNLAAGGLGKTPVTRALAEAAQRAGLRPAVLTRGYGGSGRSGVLRAGAWSEGPASAAACGDEPLWLSRVLPEVPVVVGRDRARGARALLAGGDEKVDLFLLDDGFQHRGLFRDCDLVLLDAERPVANGRLLPAGPLREPPSALRRADHLLLTGDGDGPGAEALAELAAAAPGVPWSYCRRRPGAARPLGRTEGDPVALRGRRVHAVTGIARPRRFLATLAEAGVTVAGTSAYRDHHCFTDAELRAAEERARAADAVPVTTAKDAMRLEGRADPARGWLVLELEMELEGGWDAFLTRLLPA